jgi:hypothetical protein
VIDGLGIAYLGAVAALFTATALAVMVTTTRARSQAAGLAQPIAGDPLG